MRKHRMGKVNADRHQPVCQQDVSEDDERDSEKSVESLAVDHTDGLDERSVSENGWYRSDPECC